MREYADTRSKTLWPSDGEGNGTRAIPKNDLYTGSLFVTERQGKQGKQIEQIYKY